MIKRLFIWFFVGLSLLGNVYLFILLLNAGVLVDGGQVAGRAPARTQHTRTYCRSERMGRKKASDIVALSEEIERQGIIVNKAQDGSLEIGNIIFENQGWFGNARAIFRLSNRRRRWERYYSNDQSTVTFMEPAQPQSLSFIC